MGDEAKSTSWVAHALWISFLPATCIALWWWPWCKIHLSYIYNRFVPRPWYHKLDAECQRGVDHNTASFKCMRQVNENLVKMCEDLCQEQGVSDDCPLAPAISGIRATQMKNDYLERRTLQPDNALKIAQDLCGEDNKICSLQPEIEALQEVD